MEFRNFDLLGDVGTSQELASLAPATAPAEQVTSIELAVKSTAGVAACNFWRRVPATKRIEQHPARVAARGVRYRGSGIRFIYLTCW